MELDLLSTLKKLAIILKMHNHTKEYLEINTIIINAMTLQIGDEVMVERGQYANIVAKVIGYNSKTELVLLDMRVFGHYIQIETPIDNLVHKNGIEIEKPLNDLKSVPDASSKPNAINELSNVIEELTENPEHALLQYHDKLEELTHQEEDFYIKTLRSYILNDCDYIFLNEKTKQNELVAKIFKANPDLLTDNIIPFKKISKFFIKEMCKNTNDFNFFKLFNEGFVLEIISHQNKDYILLLAEILFEIGIRKRSDVFIQTYQKFPQIINYFYDFLLESHPDYVYEKSLNDLFNKRYDERKYPIQPGSKDEEFLAFKIFGTQPLYFLLNKLYIKYPTFDNLDQSSSTMIMALKHVAYSSYLSSEEIKSLIDLNVLNENESLYQIFVSNIVNKNSDAIAIISHLCFVHMKDPSNEKINDFLNKIFNMILYSKKYKLIFKTGLKEIYLNESNELAKQLFNSDRNQFYKLFLDNEFIDGGMGYRKFMFKEGDMVFASDPKTGAYFFAKLVSYNELNGEGIIEFIKPAPIKGFVGEYHDAYKTIYETKKMPAPIKINADFINTLDNPIFELTK
jgi:hypothetical protein